MFIVYIQAMIVNTAFALVMGVECYYFYESVVFNNFMTSLSNINSSDINDELQNGCQRQ